MIYSDILSNIKTVDQARELISEIDTLLSSLFQTQNQNFEQSLRSISINTAKYLKSILVNLNDKDKINNVLIGLKENLQKLKVLKLSLAFEPRELTIDSLFAWVLKNLGVGIVLDIKKDKSLLGGTIIEFEGKYKDYSLKKRLEEAFQSRRKEIMNNETKT